MKTQLSLSLWLSLLFASLLVVAAPNFASAQANTEVVGRWKSIDDATGKPKSVVEITKVNDEFKGRIAQLIEPSKPNPLCEKCDGDKKDKPIEGLEIIWGLKETKAGEEWADGQILDPQSGKTYKARLRLKENGEKLEVRGFLGVSLFGRSQTWVREK